ncbi:hypothetical protein QBC39DRAFT_355888 [Podospora conica]|nr:hypothetical protein QBC39DRAFT_355888 [Schizothecium conicum]
MDDADADDEDGSESDGSDSDGSDSDGSDSDGSDSDSDSEDEDDSRPWVARVQSQLRDPRAYMSNIVNKPPDWDSPPLPPFIFAARAVSKACEEFPIRTRDRGGAIFEYLASKDPNLATKPCIDVTTSIRAWRAGPPPPMLPLDYAVKVTTGDYRVNDVNESNWVQRLAALVRTGALNINFPHNRCRLWLRFFESFSEHDPATNTYRVFHQEACKVLGAVWDAGLHHYSMPIDAVFLRWWEEGLARELPRIGSFVINMERYPAQLDLYLHVIDFLEGKAPGFKDRPLIKTWLTALFRAWPGGRRLRSSLSLMPVGDWRRLGGYQWGTSLP